MLDSRFRGNGGGKIVPIPSDQDPLSLWSMSLWRPPSRGRHPRILVKLGVQAVAILVVHFLFLGGWDRRAMEPTAEVAGDRHAGSDQAQISDFPVSAALWSLAFHKR